ncbi:hypothetical protein AB0C42_28845, partial [Micromonospora taraxaci]|uniref:hypothetical protein n=1 Tax=Micromonospora taraxaci TaxID=1316803 RepID=UPI0033EF8A46
RLVLLVTVTVQVVFWLSVPVLPYGLLLVASFAARTTPSAGDLLTVHGPVARPGCGRSRS